MVQQMFRHDPLPSHVPETSDENSQDENNVIDLCSTRICTPETDARAAQFLEGLLAAAAKRGKKVDLSSLRSTSGQGAECVECLGSLYVYVCGFGPVALHKTHLRRQTLALPRLADTRGPTHWS